MLFVKFIKKCKTPIILFICFSVICGAISFLYGNSAESFIYPLLLCTVISIIVLIASYYRFKERYLEIYNIINNIDIGISSLPPPKDVELESYTELINELDRLKAEAQTERDMKISDINDYYTMWVHQIKTPIAAMNLLLQKNEIEREDIKEQLFRIEEYVEMVLTYIRCGDDASDYVIRECSLDDIIKPAVRKYAKQFIRKKITLSYSEMNLSVITDEKWLTFVVEQILSNALKYTNDGGKISVYIRDGKQLVIEDTGIGIAAEDLPRVCEKGYTGYNGRADKKSTGIGLFLCKHILDGLSHKMSITSQVGKGTAVMINFDVMNIRFE